ncbi:MAG: hypothetical protein HRT99_04385 [Mycoplasmatales bacterium]|nr:hypothetical protein [Mycoplasmatales bacterium]
MIGIIVADSNEINEIKFKLIKKKKINQFVFFIYMIDNKKVVFVHSGIGIANAAAATQELISSFDISEIYNYGAVGGDENVNLYDIITPEKIYYHDVITPWYPRGQTPNEKPFYLNNLLLEKTNFLASGSSFIKSKKDIKEIKNEIKASIFDMETAAIAQIAEKNGIKLNVIKCVSDLIGNENNLLENINFRIKKAGILSYKKTIELLINK